MAKQKNRSAKDQGYSAPPSLSPEAREQRIVGMAMELAEQQIKDGTASAAVITHFLKIGSTEERLRREKLEEENKLLRAKTEALQSAKRSEELMQEAIAAFQNYSRGYHQEDEIIDEEELY